MVFSGAGQAVEADGSHWQILKVQASVSASSCAEYLLMLPTNWFNAPRTCVIVFDETFKETPGSWISLFLVYLNSFILS